MRNYNSSIITELFGINISSLHDGIVSQLIERVLYLSQNTNDSPCEKSNRTIFGNVSFPRDHLKLIFFATLEMNKKSRPYLICISKDTISRSTLFKI